MGRKRYNEKEDTSIGGLVFTGCMFLGAGIGFIISPPYLVAGGAIGGGIGFLAQAAIKYLAQENKMRERLDELEMREWEREQAKRQGLLELEELERQKELRDRD